MAGGLSLREQMLVGLRPNRPYGLLTDAPPEAAQTAARHRKREPENRHNGFSGCPSGRTSRRNAYFPVALLASRFNAPAWTVIPVGNFSNFPVFDFLNLETIKSGALASSKRVISIFF